MAMALTQLAKAPAAAAAITVLMVLAFSAFEGVGGASSAPHRSHRLVREVADPRRSPIAAAAGDDLDASDAAFVEATSFGKLKTSGAGQISPNDACADRCISLHTEQIELCQKFCKGKVASISTGYKAIEEFVENQWPNFCKSQGKTNGWTEAECGALWPYMNVAGAAAATSSDNSKTSGAGQISLNDVCADRCISLHTEQIELCQKFCEGKIEKIDTGYAAIIHFIKQEWPNLCKSQVQTNGWSEAKCGTEWPYLKSLGKDVAGATKLCSSWLLSGKKDWSTAYTGKVECHGKSAEISGICQKLAEATTSHLKTGGWTECQKAYAGEWHAKVFQLVKGGIGADLTPYGEAMLACLKEKQDEWDPCVAANPVAEGVPVAVGVVAA